MRNNILLFILSICLIACETKELPVPMHEQGEALVTEASMGENYDYQLFYSFEKNTVVQKNLKTIWDIGFEATADGFHVILNSSKMMYAYNTQQSNFQSVTDTSGFEQGKKLDASSGNMDSTAMGNWEQGKPVFIIDRGSTIAGSIGFAKLQINNVDASGYEITFQLLPNGTTTNLHIPKDEAYNYSFLSFENGGKLVSVEPPKADWDLSFTQFSVEIPTPYLVTGVLLNTYKTTAQRDSMVSFDSIDISFAQQMTFSDARDIIGYDWKYFDFNASTYLVNSSMNFIIKTQNETYYKMHFLDFYNKAGVKGNPKWEFSKL